MSRNALVSVFVLISILIIGCDKSGDNSASPSAQDQQAAKKTPPAEPVETKILGNWKISVDRSVELCKTSPKVKPEDHEKLSSHIQRQADKLKMEITETNLKITSGTRVGADFAYNVDSTDTDAQTVTASLKEVDGVTIIFKVIDNVYLNYVSSGTDDMDYFVWEPIENVEQ